MCAAALTLACGGETVVTRSGEAVLADGAADVTNDARDALIDVRALAPPADHRATPVSCPTARGPGRQEPYPSRTSTCATDTDCADGGANGRCAQWGADAGEMSCSYDECFIDTDCTGATTACVCRAAAIAANVCVSANCRVDADCGPGGFCSPTLELTCGWGPVALRCHTAADECTNDTECPQNVSNPIGAPYCAYDPGKAHWVCSTSRCVT
jgi:hypothetical protein